MPSCLSLIISMIKLLLHRVYWRQKYILVQLVIHDWTYVKNSHSYNIMLKYASILSSWYSFLCFTIVCYVSTVLLAQINCPGVLKSKFLMKRMEKIDVSNSLRLYIFFRKVYIFFRLLRHWSSAVCTGSRYRNFTLQKQRIFFRFYDAHKISPIKKYFKTYFNSLLQ